jgi:CheY-like chemotaxis protein
MKTILVVDDELVIAEMLRTVLEDEGYRVVTAANGRAGLAALASSIPDLVLTDLMMPILDGQELARTMKASTTYAMIPIVAMSAVGQHPARDKSLFQGFLSKPFNLEVILALVERLIGKPRA